MHFLGVNWRQQISQKQCQQSTRLHGVITQTAKIKVLTVVETSHLKQNNFEERRGWMRVLNHNSLQEAM
jgi:hypothetical protein